MKKIIILTITIIFSIFSISNIYKKEENIIIEPVKEELIIIDRIKYWEENPEESPMKELEDARYLAIVADSVLGNNDSIIGKTAIMQCVINRYYSGNFGDSIKEVCTQKDQWQGVTNTSTASMDTFTLAKKVLKEYKEGTILEIPRDCVYMIVNDNSLEFRSSWYGETEVIILI